MARPYFSAAHVVGRDCVADFGAYDRTDVDFEVTDWCDHGAKRSQIARKTWDRVPTQSEHLDWLDTLRTPV